MVSAETPRVAFFTKSKRTTLYTTFIIRALRRIGCKMLSINMSSLRRLYGQSGANAIARRRLDNFRPDACVIFSSDIEDATLDYLVGRTKTALLLDDYYPVDSPLLSKIRKVDVFFLTSTGQIQAYKEAGAKSVVYLHSGVDPDDHRRGRFKKRFQSDVAFIGKANFAERVDMITLLSQRVDLKVYGARWDQYGINATKETVGVRDFRRVCASAKIVFGMDKTVDQELYFSNRTWFVLGCGGFLLTRYVPRLEDLFANHRHLAWFRELDEAVELIDYYRKNDRAREQIQEEGFRFAHEHYPFDRMASNIRRVLFAGEQPLPFTATGPDGPVPGATDDANGTDSARALRAWQPEPKETGS
ncbi:MAG: glycosyltransferase [Planctomycetota bacterium]